MDVLILAKTHMQKGTCIGGILTNGEAVRLLDHRGNPQPEDTDFEVGDVWNITWSKPQHLRPPHIEDILVTEKCFKFRASSDRKIIRALESRMGVKIWNGGPQTLFDGKLKWTAKGSGYISADCNMPCNSVGFWRPAQDLLRSDFAGKVRYTYPPKVKSFYSFGTTNPDEMWLKISYVGFKPAAEVIPAGTLVRVSLARWWRPGETGERCYLQMSGWFGLE